MSIYVDSAVARDLEQGATLPAEWYTSPAIFAAESENIFRRSWQYVGHAGQVLNPGDFFTARLGNIPIVVTRDDHGTVRAMANVCRHRGSEAVLDCAGNRKTLQCHYHGWTYNLDGTLRAAPRANEQSSFAKEELSLVPFAIETWGPMIFVNPDPKAGAFRGMIGDLPKLFPKAGVDLSRLQLARRDVYELASNWKIIIENFNECYHCPVAHPKFSEVIDTDAYHADTGHEYFSSYHGPIIGSDGPGVNYATLWPTVMLAMSAHPQAMQVLRAWPIDAEHTRETIDYFFAEGTDEAAISEYIELSDLVQREDVILCESVQRGLRSGIIKQGHLMLSRERGIQHFQKLVYRFVSHEIAPSAADR
ncbi:MAG: aromatic ring-hydroxylating oxygenase subunit alpha [Candidatus Binataceae bacterium]